MDIAAYALTKSQRVAICKWVKELKLLDRYASNLSRCVDLNQGKLHGMKSHDCHVLMQRLLLIAFNSLPKHIWKSLVELSHLFRELTSTTLNVEKLTVIEGNIPALLCKLEQIFFQSFFDSMEHVPIHLSYKDRVGGLVQYRWMYPFERFLHSLKNKVKNKERIEASICEAYLVEETSTFALFYYPDKIETRKTGYLVMLIQVKVLHLLLLYQFLIIQEEQQVDLNAAHLYVLLNCEEVQSYLEEVNPTTLDDEIDHDISSKFPAWFKHIEDMNSLNHEVYVRGTNGQLEFDFYINLSDIIQSEYIGFPIMKLVLFKYD
ncbi:hypothetical protein CR513_15224, partial [Mucuna pruriens]